MARSSLTLKVQLHARRVPGVRCPAPSARAGDLSLWIRPTTIGWAGMRGADTMVIALAVPTASARGGPFPDRALIFFLTFCVILATLVLQGLSLPSVIRAVGLLGDDGQALQVGHSPRRGQGVSPPAQGANGPSRRRLGRRRPCGCASIWWRRSGGRSSRCATAARSGTRRCARCCATSTWSSGRSSSRTPRFRRRAKHAYICSSRSRHATPSSRKRLPKSSEPLRASVRVRAGRGSEPLYC